MSRRKPPRAAPTTLRKWRVHRNLTLERVGNIIGVGPQAIHKWETGKTPVDLETLKLLAQAYETSPDALLHDPADAGLITRMRQAFSVLKNLPPDDAEKWLGVGEMMARAVPPPENK